MKYAQIKGVTLKFSIALLTAATITGSCSKTTETKPVTNDPATVTDVDGNIYTTIRIGSQLWTVENLRTTHYNDHTPIMTGLNAVDWGSTTTGAYSVYDDNNDNNTAYGKLYNWFAVNTGKLAPEGWHIASRSEWESLVKNLGGSTVAGGKLKSTSSLWMTPNTGATNSSGFSGLPSGYRGISGNYVLIGESAYWWASSERNATQGDYLIVTNELAGAAINGTTKKFGYAVRCVKN